MGLIMKLETLINGLIIKLAELIWRLMPAPFKKVGLKVDAWKTKVFQWLSALPAFLKAFVLALPAKIKDILATVDFKAIFIDSYKEGLERYKRSTDGRLGKTKKLLLAPFLIVGEWVQGLSVTQTLLLLTFTGGSILAVIGIGFSGQKLVNNHLNKRTPASVEEEILFERSVYYKKEKKHFDITNFRLPIYVAEINELRSIDIDFTATLSNRHSKMFLEKHEFQLRDHLILQVEPSVASFPLEEEGKEIIRKKLWSEINEFLKLHQIEGEVVELKITYVLAN